MIRLSTGAILAASLGCADAPAAPIARPTPQAQLVDAVAQVNAASRKAHAAGYRIILTLAVTDSTPPSVGVLLLPR